MTTKILLENVDPPGNVAGAELEFPHETVEVNMIDILAEAMVESDIPFEEKFPGYVKTKLFRLIPHLVESYYYEKVNGHQTISTVIVRSCENLRKYRVFEYQHNRSKNHGVVDVFKNGFKDWLKHEYPVLVAMESGDTVTNVSQLSLSGRKVLVGLPRGSTQGLEENVEVIRFFVERLSSFDIAAVKVFISRDATGGLDVDVRVNGADYPEGKAYIEEHVASGMVGEVLMKQYFCVS